MHLFCDCNCVCSRFIHIVFIKENTGRRARREREREETKREERRGEQKETGKGLKDETKGKNRKRKKHNFST